MAGPPDRTRSSSAICRGRSRSCSALPPFEFENWAVIALGGIPNKVQVGDMGVDGRIFPVGTKPADRAACSPTTGSRSRSSRWTRSAAPTSTPSKPSCCAKAKSGRQRGFFVAFGYTKDAEQECAAFHKRTGRIIKLLTVQEILDEEHVQKM